MPFSLKPATLRRIIRKFLPSASSRDLCFLLGTALLAYPKNFDAFSNAVFPIPVYLNRLLIFVGLVLLIIQNEGKWKTSARARRVTLGVAYVTIVAVGIWSVADLVRHFQSESKIRANLALALMSTYGGQFTVSEKIIADVKAELRFTSWREAQAVIAVVEQEIAFYRGYFEPGGESYKKALLLAQSASPDSDDLLVWLKLLEAEHVSRLRNDLDARDILHEAAALRVPAAAQCALYLNLAINSRRLGNLTESTNFYARALSVGTNNPTFAYWSLEHIDKTGGWKTMIQSYREPSGAALIAPYAEALWENGQRDESIRVLSHWKGITEAWPYYQFAIVHNLAVFQWREHKYAEASKSFRECEDLIERINQKPMLLPGDYEAYCYANFAGMLLEECGRRRPTPVDETKIKKLLTTASEAYAKRQRRRTVLQADRKSKFQIDFDYISLSAATLQSMKAYEDCVALEKRSGSFDGCDPASVAAFYECYFRVATDQKVSKDESDRISIAAKYWRFRSGEHTGVGSIELIDADF